MSHRKMAAAFSVVLTTLLMPSIHAQDQGYAPNGAAPMLIPPPLMERPNPLMTGHPLSDPAQYRLIANHAQSGTAPMPIDADLSQGAAAGPPQQAGYVRLNAPMYPCPRPNIPIWTGSTVITNQAFAPQEMLYAHTYRAMYPPFYHRVKGGWLVTPFGVRSNERWQLQGTMVEVKYRTNYPGLLSGACWLPPATSTFQPRHQ